MQVNWYWIIFSKDKEPRILEHRPWNLGACYSAVGCKIYLVCVKSEFDRVQSIEFKEETFESDREQARPSESEVQKC